MPWWAWFLAGYTTCGVIVAFELALTGKRIR